MTLKRRDDFIADKGTVCRKDEIEDRKGRNKR